MMKDQDQKKKSIKKDFQNKKDKKKYNNLHLPLHKKNQQDPQIHKQTEK